MGGDAQPQIVLQLLARYLQLGQPPARVVHAPRFVLARHASGRDSTRGTTRRCWDSTSRPTAPRTGTTASNLRGHDVRVVDPANHGMGHAHLIVVEGNALAGASDWRAGAGAAFGY